MEELAPFPYEFLAQATVHTYPNAELVWVQEEPQNMGFWHYVEDRLRTMVRVFHTDAGARDVASHTTSPGEVFSPDSSLPRVVRYVGRPVASCATGSFHIHVAETREYITDRAFE